MAKNEKSSKNVLERTYNVPLRRQWLKVARHKRAKKAAKGLREFLIKHMKPENDDPKNVKIGKYLNDHLWERGIKNPPHHVKITAVKDEKGIVRAELVGAPVDQTKSDSTKEKKAETKEKKKETKDKSEISKDKKDTDKSEKKAEPKEQETTKKTKKQPEKKETIKSDNSSKTKKE